jgi:hypothetical protein
MLLNDFWGMRMKLKESHKSYRPLTTLTFRWVQWKFFPSLFLSFFLYLAPTTFFTTFFYWKIFLYSLLSVGNFKMLACS